MRAIKRMGEFIIPFLLFWVFPGPLVLKTLFVCRIYLWVSEAGRGKGENVGKMKSGGNCNNNGSGVGDKDLLILFRMFFEFFFLLGKEKN